MAVHFDIGTSCTSLIEYDKSLMFRDTGSSLNNRECDCVEDLPLSVFIAESDSSELVLPKERVFYNPRNYLLFERLAHQNRTCIYDASDIVIMNFKDILAEPFPKTLLSFLYCQDTAGIIEHQMNHLAVCTIYCIIIRRTPL